MKFWKKLWKILTEPDGGFIAASYAVFVLLLILTLTIVGGKYSLGGFEYFIYALAFVMLVYCIYLSVVCIRRLKGYVFERTEEDSLPGHFLRDYGFRTHIYSGIRTAINFTYTLFEGVLAVVAASVWYGALCTYHFVLSFMRLFVLAFVRKEGKESLSPSERELSRAKMYGKCGGLLILLTLALSGAVVQMVVMNNGFRYAGVMIYGVAAYTTYKVTLAIINAVKAHRYRDESVQALRNINLADAGVSLLALQTAMLAAFGSGGKFTYIFNAITGAGVCLFIVGMGIYMIIRSRLKIEREKGKRG